MTTVEFYSNLPDKTSKMLTLIQQALEKRSRVTIMVESEQVASQLSADLWQNAALSFMPNVLASHSLASETPVLIDWQEKTLFQDDILINLTQRQLTVFSRFRKLIELVSLDDEDKVNARSRYKFYRDRGYEIKHFNESNISI